MMRQIRTRGADDVARSGTVQFTVPPPAPTTARAPTATIMIQTLTDTDGDEGTEHGGPSRPASTMPGGWPHPHDIPSPGGARVTR